MDSYQQTAEAPRLPEGANAIKSEKAKPVRAARIRLGKKKRYEIDVFRAWCKCCGICAAFCPRGCIRLDELGAPTGVDSDRCTGCGWCELHCPDFAISVQEKNGSAGAEESANREQSSLQDSAKADFS
jgi:2-oxoglutarate ferredoxin oxidoreductase subunit delta